MIKRKVSAMLAAVMLTASLAACAAGDGGSSPSGAGSSAPASQAESAASAASSEGDVTLKILGEFDANIDPANDPLKGEIEERTGYKLEYSMLPQDNADEKLSLEITSGAEYDILMLGPGKFRMLAKQNALMEIGDLVDQYGPTLKKIIPEETWRLATLNDGVYAIPQKNERPNIEASLAMRGDILAELGLEVPTTTTEFRAALVAIKEKYPDMVPFTHCISLDIKIIRSAFGLYTDWLEEDGKIVHWTETERAKDYYQYMIDLYNDGLFDKDFPVNKTANRDEKFTGGKAASMSYDWFSSDKIEPALKTNFPDAEIALVPPLSGDLGYEPGVVANVRFLKASSIPKSSKNAEHAIKFMDKKLEWDNFLYLTLGEEGKTFELKDGKYYPIMPEFNETRSTAYYYLNGIDEENYAEMWLARIRRNEYVGNTFDLLNADFDKYAKYDPVALMPSLESMAKYGTSNRKFIDDYQIKLITGGESLDHYDAFLEQFREAGGAAMSEEINAWYQENKS